MKKYTIVQALLVCVSLFFPFNLKSGYLDSSHERCDVAVNYPFQVETYLSDPQKGWKAESYAPLDLVKYEIAPFCESYRQRWTFRAPAPGPYSIVFKRDKREMINEQIIQVRACKYKPTFTHNITFQS